MPACSRSSLAVVVRSCHLPEKRGNQDKLLYRDAPHAILSRMSEMSAVFRLCGPDSIVVPETSFRMPKVMLDEMVLESLNPKP